MRRPVDAARVHELMRALGAAADAPGRVYFTGGATAVVLFASVEPQLYRFPAIDPKSFRAAVERAVR